MDRIVECVPNFSEGRDKAVIEAIAGAIRSVEGVKLLDVDPGADFNRTVFTFVGEPEPVLEAAFQAAKVGTRLIDMTEHKGEHARMGALDVCPFIPIKGITFDDCTELARRFGSRYWEELGIPSFLYARSAQSPDRVRLPDIRKGEYEALSEKFKDPGFKPDFGDPVFVPKSGTTGTGTRSLLLAYNVNLNTNDKSIASKIARKIRTSGVLKKDENGEKIIGPDGKSERIKGRFEGVQGGGMMYNEDIAQISMNLLDFTATNMNDVYEAIREEAQALGADVTGSEIVGLVPKESLLIAGRFYSENDDDLEDEEELVFRAIQGLGLSDLYEFKPERKVIDYMVVEDGPLASMDVKGFLEELASNSPAPGGGSVAALSGSLGAALLEMVCNLTVGKKNYEEAWVEMKAAAKDIGIHRMRLLELVDEDTNAFNDVMKAFKLPKGTDEEKVARSAAIQAGYKKAIDTPMDTALKCLELLELATPVAQKGNRNSITDVGVGADMAAAGLVGAVMNVRINLGSIKDKEYVEGKEGAVRAMISRKDDLLSRIQKEVSSKL
ncbi:MAG: glutamate formimidoyltransferase [Thermoplasmata archaeon]|nr:glutamate formimidoyltransferase [Thermoplasmata archaeon]